MKGRGHCAGCGFEGEMDDFLKHSCSEENKRLRAALKEADGKYSDLVITGWRPIGLLKEISDAFERGGVGVVGRYVRMLTGTRLALDSAEKAFGTFRAEVRSRVLASSNPGTSDKEILYGIAGLRADLHEAESDLASLTDYINIWAREDGVEQAESPRDAKKTLNMIWVRVSQNLAESQARCASLEMKLSRLRLHSSPGQANFHEWAMVDRKTWEEVMEGEDSGPSALEAVREVVDDLEREASIGDGLAQAKVANVFLSGLARKLRSAFGLGGEI